MKMNQMNHREETTKYWVKKGSDCNFVARDASLLEKKSSDEQNLHSDDGLLPNRCVSFSTNNCTVHGISKPENKEPVVFVESSQHATRRRLNKSLFQNISRSNHVRNWETEDCKNSDVKSNQPFTHNSNYNCKKGPETWEEDFTWLQKRHCFYAESMLAPFDLHLCKNADEAERAKYYNQHVTTHSFNRLNAYPIPSVHVQQNAHCQSNIWVPAQGRLQPYNGMKIQKGSHVLGRTFCGHPIPSVHVQQNVNCESNLWVPALGRLQLSNGMKIQTTSHILGRSFCAYPIPSVHVQQNAHCKSNVGVPAQGRLYPYNGMNIQSTSHVLEAKKWIPVRRKERIGFAGFCNVINYTLPFHASGYSNSFPGSGVNKECKFRKTIDSETKAKKSVPVQVVEMTSSVGVGNVFSDTSPSSCGEMNDKNSEGNITPISGSNTTSESKNTDHIATLTTYMISNEDGAQSFENESAIAGVPASKSAKGSISEDPKGTSQSVTGSQVTAEALSAAYSLQLESERAQLEIGQPLAEFERFIHSASPIISFSHISAKCAVCSVSQLTSSFLCKHQMPSLSLRAVWNWYQKPGNYGLEVNAVDYNNRKGRQTEMTPFQAYFIPFLSAVQLFSYVKPEKHDVELNCSSPKRVFVKHSPEAIQPGQFWVGSKTSEINLDSIEEVCISNNASSCKTGVSHGFFSSISCLGNSELIFEFFESELPHKRKPLHIKIAELVNSGTSNLVFGDPSKLESMDLHDLHPASWFSVAWYPIYRIPEGNFHASFLTYHSLGHVVQRCVATDSLEKKATCIVAPVLGLESYNTQGECWFDLTIPIKTSLNIFSQCKTSEILVKRHRTLEENASSFARGCVCKNNVMVVNRQPDYEFFISRKC